MYIRRFSSVVIMLGVWLPLIFTASVESSVTISSGMASSFELVFGDAIVGSLDTMGEVDSYIFDGRAGDVILFRMSNASGSVHPSLMVSDEEGAALCSHYDTIMAEISSCVIENTGTYTVTAADYGDDGTGNYYIYAQRINAPSGAIAVTYGEVRPGSLPSAAELDTYSITGMVGDLLLVQMVPTSGSIASHLRVLDSNGSVICQHHTYYSSGPALIAGCALPASDSYVLLAGDYNGIRTGAYNIFISKLNQPSGGALPIAELHSGTIAAAAELDVYSFSGSVGDSFILRMATTSDGGLDPHLRLYNSYGVEVCKDFDRYYGVGEILDCTLATTDTHTLVVGDYEGLEVGNYDLFVVRLNDPVNAWELPYAQIQEHSLNQVAQLNTYTFNGTEGDVILVQVAVPDASFASFLRIYSGEGILLCRDIASNLYNDVILTRCILPQDGVYTAIVGCNSNSHSCLPGDYQLFVQRLNSPLNSVALRIGKTLPAVISLPGELDTYTFRAASADVVSVRMSSTGNKLDPFIHIYGNDGVELCKAYAISIYEDSTAEIASCTLPFSGTYALVASEYGANQTGSYSLELKCKSDSCGFPLILSEKLYLPLILQE